MLGSTGRPRFEPLPQIQITRGSQTQKALCPERHKRARNLFLFVVLTAQQKAQRTCHERALKRRRMKNAPVRRHWRKTGSGRRGQGLRASRYLGLW